METLREKYLNNLNNNLKEMTRLTEQQFGIVGAMLQGTFSDEAIRLVRENESRIDRTEMSIREELVDDIVLQTPRAGDLRKVVASLTIISEVERIGDLLENIGKRAISLRAGNPFRQDLQKILGMASDMFRNVIFAVETQDARLAESVISSDLSVNELHRNIYQKLLATECGGEPGPTDLLQQVLNIGRISYNIERIGDNCTNIAENVVFMAKGIDITHNKK